MANVGTLNIDFQTNVARLVNDMRRSSRAVERGTRNMERSLNSAGRATRRFVAGFLTIATLRVGSAVSDEMASIEGRIKNATRTQEEFTQAYRDLLQTAISTGGSLSASVDTFQRISFVRDEIQASVQEMTAFNDVVAKLGIISGASNAALRAGQTQLGQGLSSNILRAEEYNSIMENIPAVGRAIASEFGVTTGQLRQLVLAGEVLSEDVFAAILRSSEQANEQFDKWPLTIGRATSSLVTQFKALFASIDTAADGSSKLAKAIQSVANFVGDINDDIKLIGSLFKIQFLIVEEFVSRIYTNIRNKINETALFLEQLRGKEVGAYGGSEFQFVPIDNSQNIKALAQEIQLRKNLTVAQARLTSQVEESGIRETSIVRELSKDYKELAANIVSKDADDKKKRIAEELKIQARQRAIYMKVIDDLADKHSDTIDRQAERYKNLDNIVNSAIEGRIKSWKDLGDVALNTLQQMISAELQLQSVSSSSGILGGLLKGAAGFLGFGSTGASGVQSISNPNLSGASYLLPTFARGGITSGPSIAGEAGQPEAVVPLPDGKSIPVNFSGGSASGVKIDYVDMRGASLEAVGALRQMITDLRADVPTIAQGAVQDRFSRNPQYMRG